MDVAEAVRAEGLPTQRSRVAIVFALSLSMCAASPSMAHMSVTGAQARTNAGVQALFGAADPDVVVLHPTRDVSLSVDDSNPAEAIVDSVDAAAFHFLFVSNHDEQPRDHIALLDFEMPAHSVDRRLSGAELRLYAESVSLPNGQPTRDLWVAGNANAWDPEALADKPVPPSCCILVRWTEPQREAGWIAWDVSALVGAWLDGAANHGLRILPSPHLLSDHYYYTFWSAEGQVPPELVLSFNPTVSRVTAFLPLVLARGSTTSQASDR